MDFTCKTKTLTSIIRDIEKERYNFSHPLQRREGQWGKLQKSELIDTILRPYPIDPVRMIKEENTLSVIDGKQRLTTIRDFMKDGYKLSRSIGPVTIDGDTYAIAGKKYSDLEEAVQEKINGYEMQLYIFTDCTQEDIREMFRRQNNGTPLSKSQKTTTHIDHELSARILHILSHDFWEKTALTNGQIRKSEDRDLVLEALMLISDFEVTGFQNSDILNFITYYNEKPQPELFETLESLLNALSDRMPERQKYLKKLTIPMVIYGLYQARTEGKSQDAYMGWLNGFFASYDTQEDYLKYCKSQTAKPENVLGRLNYFKKAVSSL